MNRSIFRFLLGQIILTCAILPANHYIIHAFLKTGFGTAYYLMYAYFFLLTFAVHLVLLRDLEKRPQKFVIDFMAVMGIKIFLSLAILVVVLLTTGLDKKIFGVNFMLVYLAFSTFSVFRILAEQKRAGEFK